jgi:predicted nucleic acid-binding protein
MTSCRRQHLAGLLDGTAASQAIDDLRDWPGERFGHRNLFGRAWELRNDVRGWDAVYVALAEVMGATLITLDVRLAGAQGPRCPVEVVAA